MVESGDQTHPPPPPAAKVLFSKYELGRLLGCGGSGKVYHARNLQTGQSVAIKIISKLRISKKAAGPAARAAVTREIAIARRLRHPRIVRLLEVLASRSKIYFVLEFLKGGELFSKLSQGRLSEDHSRRLFRQLISAVGYCHSRGVFHRDLKPENLLLDDAGDLKVTDFGLSAVADDQSGGDGLFHTLCGTPAYVAPEILSKKGYDGAKVDLWSCGVILYVLNAGYLPFNDPNLMEMYRKIYRGRYRCPRWTSPELRRLIGRLLDPNPETRITVEEILEDSWFRKGVDGAEMEKTMRFHDAVEIEKSDGEDEADGEEGRQLNAFDLISFSSGLNLAGLFDEGSDRERFVTAEPAEGILGKMEELGRREGLAVRRKGNSGVILEGQNGNLVARVEVYWLTGGWVVVEGVRGDFWGEKLKPVLQGPVAGVEE